MSSTMYNTAYADISTQDSYEDVDPTPVTESESERVPQIATDAYQTLYGQEDQSMELGDFIAELRDMNIRTAVIDEVLEYLTDNGWVSMWQKGSTGETWITALEGDDD